MDTTYVAIMLVVFLVIAALAIDVGYMYVSDEDLQHSAEVSALAGAQALKQRIRMQIQADPAKLRSVLNDQEQSSARTDAINQALGKHTAVALVEIANNNTNRLTTTNDITVGFWNISTQTYTPDATPVNAIQVRARRTAESENVGLGDLGRFLAKISGFYTSYHAPEAIAALPPKVYANIAVCTDVCGSACAFPDICSIPERKMVREPWDRKEGAAVDRYAYTSLLFSESSGATLSDMICGDMPAQEVCGKTIFTTLGSGDDALRDMEAMMYNPTIDTSNKEFDKATGKVTGWWIIAPVTTCPSANQGFRPEQRTVVRYAMLRISRICATGVAGCRQLGGTAHEAPTATCGNDTGLFIDRISCAGCGAAILSQLPGLQPILVSKPKAGYSHE